MPNVDDLRNWILEEAHEAGYSIYPGSTKMYHDNIKVFWWDDLKRNIAKFVPKCPNFQQVKGEQQKSGGLLQEIKFLLGCGKMLVGLPHTRRKYDSIWVVIDRLTKSTDFILVKFSYSVEDYEIIYIDKIVILHGFPLSIISDRGTLFASMFWRSFQRGLCTQVT